MRELYEQFLSVFWIAIHHRWAVAIAMALICLVGWSVVFILPDKYEADASIYFDQETALSPVLQGIATESSSLEERALLIRRTLTTRASLLEIAKNSGVDLSQYPPEAAENFLNNMFKQVKYC